MRIKKKRAAQTTLGKPRARSHERGRNLSLKKENIYRNNSRTNKVSRLSRAVFPPSSVVAVIFFCFFFLELLCTMVHTFEKTTFFSLFFYRPPLSRVWRHTRITLSRKKTKILTFKRARRGVSAYAIPFERGPLTIFAFE